MIHGPNASNTTYLCGPVDDNGDLVEMMEIWEHIEEDNLLLWDETTKLLYKDE